jgi:hypothetical protein
MERGEARGVEETLYNSDCGLDEDNEAEGYSERELVCKKSARASERGGLGWTTGSRQNSIINIIEDPLPSLLSVHCSRAL